MAIFFDPRPHKTGLFTHTGETEILKLINAVVRILAVDFHYICIIKVHCYKYTEGPS